MPPKYKYHRNRESRYNSSNLNKSETDIEIVVLEDNSYHILIKAEINGISGDMIIDTGASITVIDSHIISKDENTKIEMENKITSSSVSGDIDNIELVNIKKIRIAERNFKNQIFALMDLDYVNNMYDKHLNRKIIGLLGCDFCIKYQAIIDYKNKKFILHKLR